MLLLRKLMLTGLCAVLPFTSNPVHARAAGSQAEFMGDLGAHQHRIGTAQVFLPVIPASLLGRLPSIIAAAKTRNEVMGAELDAAIAELQQALGVGRTQTLNFCRIIGEAGIRPSRMGERLTDISRQRRELLARVETLSGQLFTNKEPRNGLIEALENADLARADRLVEEYITSNQATAVVPVAGVLIHDLRGEIAQARLRYRQASDHFREAANLMPLDQSERRLFYLESAAYLLFKHSDEYGDSEALAQSVNLYRGLAVAHSREKEPLAWGKAQHNLGTAALVQGMMDGSMTLLEESVEALQAALLTRSRAREPLLWAASQQNLGRALSSLGKMSGDISLLKQAAWSHRAALEERSREALPLEWAESRSALATVLLDLGRWEQDSGLLGQAAEYYSAALEEIKRERAPYAWAVTKYNLGHALYNYGVMAKDRRALERAAESYSDALGEQPKERDPAQWAATQTSLGSALTALAMWEPGTARLEQAVVAFRNALKVRERERTPITWARTQTSLGIALRRLGLRQGRSALLEEALDVTREAQAAYIDAGMVHYEAYFMDRLVDWEAELAAIGHQDAAAEQ
jgi:tetratricopeptide (TPR) repeat protein